LLISIIFREVLKLRFDKFLLTHFKEFDFSA
jgi:hypothetical protein